MPKIDFLMNPTRIFNDLKNPRVYSRGVKVVLYTLLGKDMPWVCNDRIALEQVILSYFVKEDRFSRILFAGCGSYTKHYEKWFKYKQEYWTIDINPFKKIYGAKKHIIDSYSNVGDYFKENSLDAIICNGVFGFGWNEKEDVEKGFAGSYNSLRKSGVLVVGWRNSPETLPFPLETCESLAQFQPYVFPPVSASQVSVAQCLKLVNKTERHMFNFYVK